MAPNPLTLCSIRDILQSRKIERYRQTISEVNAWFDHVLVHADPAVVTLKETFPLADELNGKVFYSGYLSAQANSGCEREEQANEEQANEEQDRTNRDGRGEVIVSAGGGAVSLELLQSAIAARQYSKLNNHTWRLLVGRNLVTDQFDELRDHAGDNIIVERNRPDFPRLLSACAVSVSQAGYNTVLDILAAGCRSVLVPYSQNGETEQTFRAKKFSGMGRTILLQEKDLDARQLAAAVDRAARIDLSKCRHINMDGASQAARFIEREYLHRQRVKHAD